MFTTYVNVILPKMKTLSYSRNPFHVKLHSSMNWRGGGGEGLNKYLHLKVEAYLKLGGHTRDNTVFVLSTILEDCLQAISLPR